ncbi:MAG: MFS transporter [Candidatus Lokiarchaeota archaeon]|nr:MFS transporter [Candidatus Lokiarchaeota archaeon]
MPEENISVKTKLNFSVGNLANYLLNGLVFGNLTFFYQVKLGANTGLLAIGWLIFAIWNTANDPIVSYIVDNTRTKIGRRIPYIRYGSIFYGLAFIFCWIPISPLDNEIGLFINFLAALFLLDTMFTIVGVCYFSLPNEIAITAKQRASLGVYSAVIGFINLVFGLVVPIILLTGPEETHPFFVPAMIIIGLGSSLILFVSSFGIKENMFAQLQEHEGFIEGLRLTLKNKPFWILMIPAFLLGIIFPIFSTGILYYISYNIAGQTPIFVLLAIILGIVLGMVLNLKKITTWQPRKTMIINMLLAAVGFTILFFIGSNAIFAAIPFLIIGIGYAGGMVANPVLMGDAIDNDELITGKRREAIYGGVNAIVTKPAISIANFIYLSVIAAFGFEAPNGVIQPQTDMALIGLLFAFCIIPALLLALTALGLRWYPLDGPEWLDKKKHIMELHEEKEKEYLQSLS